MSTGKRSFLFKCNGSENVLNWTILCHLMSLSLTLSQLSIIEKAYLFTIRAPQTFRKKTFSFKGPSAKRYKERGSWSRWWSMEPCHGQTSLAFLILLCNEPLDLSYRSIKADQKGTKLNKLNVFARFIVVHEQKIKKWS